MPPERLTVHPSGGYHPAMTPSLRALANAGVPVLEAAPLAPGGVAAPTLLAELYVFYGDSVTSRLPRVRSDDARAAWLNEQLETLGPSERYYAMFDQPSAEWMYIAPGSDPRWLARVWATHVDMALLLSEDGSRLVMVLGVVGIPDLLALAHRTTDVLALRADRERLDSALSDVAGLLRVAHPPARISLRTDELFLAPVFTTLPASSPPQRRDTWFADAFERWRTTAPALDDHRMPGELGPYEVSLGGAPYVASLAVYAETPAVLARVWAKAGHGRLVILDGARTRALALTCANETFEARIVLLA